MLATAVTKIRDAVAGFAGRTTESGEQAGEQRGIRTERLHADRDDDVVVFLIGMRVNAVWKVHRWLPIFLLGPRLVRGLRADAESGLLGSWTFVSPPRTVGFVQYWASFDDLREYARDADRGHVDACGEYSEQADAGAVGIWHETYTVDRHETVYNNTPPRGLGAADGTDLVPATGRFESAAGRLSGAEQAPDSERGAEAGPPADSTAG